MNINSFTVTSGTTVKLNKTLDFSSCNFVAIYIQSPYKSLYSNLQPINSLGRYNFVFGDTSASTKIGLVEGVKQGSNSINIDGISTSRTSEDITIYGYEIV
ncbi:MAG: hypothetical protein ACRC4T_25105 [Cetobacterium sp.]